MYFHPYTIDREGLGFHGWDTGVHRLNSHYIFGLRLVLVEMGHTYVATLEDDLVPAPGYLSYHQDMKSTSLSDENVLAVLSYPNGPWHDCHVIADKLLNRGVCRGDDHAKLYKSGFFAGWGAGIPIRALEAYLPAWNFSGIYDGILNGLMGDGVYALAACR